MYVQFAEEHHYDPQFHSREILIYESTVVKILQFSCAKRIYQRKISNLPQVPDISTKIEKSGEMPPSSPEFPNWWCSVQPDPEPKPTENSSPRIQIHISLKYISARLEFILFISGNGQRFDAHISISNTCTSCLQEKIQPLRSQRSSDNGHPCSHQYLHHALQFKSWGIQVPIRDLSLRNYIFAHALCTLVNCCRHFPPRTFATTK